MKILFRKPKEWIFYILFIYIMVLVVSQKVNFHEDELLSYNLANSTSWFSPIDGVVYSPASEPFEDALEAKGGLDLSNVWMRQSNDVHPPFYYVLLHIICTLFPETFSMQYAAIINILFQLLTFAVLRLFLKSLILEKKIINIISVAYIMSPGILSITTFLRMYVCVIFWNLLFTYIIFENMNEQKSRNYVGICIVTICGALTHYYFIIYSFFLSLIVCLWGLIEKHIKEVGKYIVTMTIAGGTSILVFPAIIGHMFRSNRGVQSIDNLKSSNILEQLRIYGGLLDENLFGDMLLFGIIVIIITVGLKVKRFGLGESFSKEKKYICLSFAIVGYIAFVAKSAPMNEMRYLSPIFAVVYPLFLVVLFRCICFLFSGRRCINYIYGIIVLVMLIEGWHDYEWEYLYRDTKDRVEYAANEGNQAQGICVYNYDWAVLHSYREISQVKDIIFYRANDYNEFVERSIDLELEKEIALFIVGKEAHVFINRFMEEHPEYVLKKDNGQFKYVHSFYLAKDN